MHQSNLKAVNETIMPAFVQWYNTQKVDSESELKVVGEAKVAPHILNMQNVQELYIQNEELMRDIELIFHDVVSLPINWASEYVQCDLTYSLWCREYNSCSHYYLITCRSEWGPAYPVIQESGVLNPETGAVTVLYRNHNL
jgi:hypothetical protein